jgi:hypothetical protein
VTTLLVSEPNLFAGGGEYSRRIAAQSESAFVADGYARLLAEERSPWAGCLQNSALGRLAGRQQPDSGSDTPWFTQLCQLLPENADRRRAVAPYADSDRSGARDPGRHRAPCRTLDGVGKPAGLAQLIASHS